MDLVRLWGLFVFEFEFGRKGGGEKIYLASLHPAVAGETGLLLVDCPEAAAIGTVRLNNCTILCIISPYEGRRGSEERKRTSSDIYISYTSINPLHTSKSLIHPLFSSPQTHPYPPPP